MSNFIEKHIIVVSKLTLFSLYLLLPHNSPFSHHQSQPPFDLDTLTLFDFFFIFFFSFSHHCKWKNACLKSYYKSLFYQIIMASLSTCDTLALVLHQNEIIPCLFSLVSPLSLNHYSLYGLGCLVILNRNFPIRNVLTTLVQLPPLIIILHTLLLM